MALISFNEIFSGDYLQVVTQYSKQIQRILDSYDIAIFMARKAICFYKSMVINKKIKPTKCQVISSRVLEYNTIGNFRDKKIAVIDDVVVKGKQREGL